MILSILEGPADVVAKYSDRRLTSRQCTTALREIKAALPFRKEVSRVFDIRAKKAVNVTRHICEGFALAILKDDKGNERGRYQFGWKRNSEGKRL